MQRDRDFRSYEDGEARYELRPSVWGRADRLLGAGSRGAVQLNTRDETNDNIVAYWVPERPPTPGQPLTSRTGCIGSARRRCDRPVRG